MTGESRRQRSIVARSTSAREPRAHTSKGRLRPVSMAAATTVLGVIRLVGDTFFVSRALAVMHGLTFATVLTLVIVPTLLTTVYRVPSPARR